MLAILNNVLVHIEPLPVMPLQFRVEYDRDNQRMELWHGQEQVEYGVTWYGTRCKVDGKTGKLAHIPPQKASIRAVFGDKHLDFTF